MPGRLAGSWQVQYRELKTGQHKVQLKNYEDDPLCPSGYIMYLSMANSQRTELQFYLPSMFLTFIGRVTFKELECKPQYHEIFS